MALVYVDDAIMLVGESKFKEAPISIWLDDDCLTIDEAKRLVAALQEAIRDATSEL